MTAPNRVARAIEAMLLGIAAGGLAAVIVLVVLLVLKFT